MYMSTVTKILGFVLIVILLSLYNKCLVMNTSSIPATALEENSFNAVLKFFLRVCNFLVTYPRFPSVSILIMLHTFNMQQVNPPPLKSCAQNVMV